MCAAALVLVGLSLPWTTVADGQMLVLFGALDRVEAALDAAERSGWERLAWFDIALVLVVALVLAATVVRDLRLPAAALALVALCAVVAFGLLDDPEPVRGPLSIRAGAVSAYPDVDVAPLGPALCLAGLALAAAALSWRRRSTDP